MEYRDSKRPPRTKGKEDWNTGSNPRIGRSSRDNDSTSSGDDRIRSSNDRFDKKPGYKKNDKFGDKRGGGGFNRDRDRGNNFSRDRNNDRRDGPKKYNGSGPSFGERIEALEKQVAELKELIEKLTQA